MGVTIDSIQIEIESSSTNAAKGIDSLAKALEGLKKNGSFKTVTTNLNNLSASLQNLPNVHQASNALRTLANSIEKLKGVGTVASLSNSLKKLPEALKAVSTIDLTKTEAQLEGVARAVSPLSNIKAGGLGTMVNALKNLGKVTESLDDDTIKAFAEKIEQLNEELGPFAQKMSSIKSAFSAVNSNARSATSSVRDFGEGVDASALNLSSFIEVARTVVDTVMNLVRTFTEFMASAVEWDGIAARFGRSFGSQAQETYDWIQRLNEEMGINVQQFMQYSSLYAQMLTGFGVANEDAGKMALGYTELTYDIWASANDRYKKFEDAAEAVASAIAGEVEPIRRAGFTIVESTLAETAAYHGLDISLANATEAQKSYLRYLTLVDQAHSTGTIGVYAKELNTAEGMLRTLNQQWKSLTQSFASLFVPLLVKALPYIQAFVDLLKEGVYWLANLLGVEIQKVDFKGYDFGAGALDKAANSAGNAADALGTATEAAKELKNATLGIDELNVISPTSSANSGSGGSGGTGGVGGSGFEGLDIESLWDETIFDTIQSDVDAIKKKIKGWLPVIATVAGAIGGLRLIGMLSDLDAFKTKLKSLNEVKGISAIGKSFKNIKEFFAAAKQMAPEVGWLAALFPKLSTALTGVGTAIAGISAPVWGGIAAAIVAVGSAVYFLIENWDEMTQVVKNFFKENIAPKLEEIGKHFDKIKEALGPLWDNVLAPLFKGIADFVKSIDWNSFLGGIGKLFEWLGGIITAFVGGALAGLINAIASILEGVVQVASGIISTVRGLFDIIIGIFTLDGEKISEGWSRIWSGVVDVVKGAYDATIGAVVNLVKGIIDWFTEMWDVLVGHSIVPDTINAIVKWFTSLPSKIFGSIEKFATGIVDKFKGMWSNLSSWWNNSKTKLKEYTPSIGSIYDKLKSRWDSAKTWWNEKKSKLKEYTPSIGSIYEKVYERWKNARDWWNSKKGSFKSYTPSIGSIVDKVKSAWNSAKSWWSKNVGGLSTKLNISVPKIEVKWKTAEAFGKSFKYPTGFSLKFAANGGIFDQGSLIWAGEHGPEVMAKAAGGKTGVMNVQQMQDAVYEGVYAAVSAAMRSNGGGDGTQAVNVYLDGKQITSAVEKRQRERGASIMGNEVYSY